MNNLGFFWDVATPPASTMGAIGLIAGVVFLLICLAGAYVAFRMLKKTFSMAIRLIIVGIIVLIAIVGSVSFWWLNSGKSSRPAPPRTNQSR